MSEPEHEPPPRTRAGEVIREGTKVGKFFASLSPVQFQAFALMWLTVFTCSLCGYIVYKWQGSQNEQLAIILRSAETQSELNRQNCHTMIKEAHAVHSEERREVAKLDVEREQTRSKFEAEERAKDRAVVGAAMKQFQDWREMLGPILKKLPLDPDCPEFGVGAAPMPRAKIVNGS